MNKLPYLTKITLYFTFTHLKSSVSNMILKFLQGQGQGHSANAPKSAHNTGLRELYEQNHNLPCGIKDLKSSPSFTFEYNN